MDIIVDSREQKPLWHGTGVLRTGLKVGDYTTVLLHNHYHIERKSPQDLYGTITKGHLRFRDEIIRAWDLKIRLSVYVEDTRENFVTKNFPGAHRLKIKGEHLEKIISKMEKRYKLDIIWCKSRIQCKQKVYERLGAEERAIGLYKKSRSVFRTLPQKTVSRFVISSAKQRSSKARDARKKKKNGKNNRTTKQRK